MTINLFGPDIDDIRLLSDIWHEAVREIDLKVSNVEIVHVRKEFKDELHWYRVHAYKSGDGQSVMVGVKEADDEVV